MRACRPLVLVAVVCLALVAGGEARAGEDGEPDAAPVATQGEALTAKALDVMRLRMEALLGEAETLARLGRLEEALAVYREVGEVHREGLASLGSLTGPAAAQRTPGALAGRAAGPDGPRAAPAGSATEAVERGLGWLAAQQVADGRWRAAKPMYDIGVTGLAACAFLGAGHVPGSSGRASQPAYGAALERALRWLVGQQDPDGCVGPRTTQQYMYNHAIAALALVEAYHLSGAAWLRQPAERATAFTLAARNPYMAWRYGVRPGDNDTSVTAWAVMGLRSADLPDGERKIDVDPQAFHGAVAWLDKVTDEATGRVGYLQRGTGPARTMEAVDRFPADRSEAMTAAGMLTRVLCGGSVDSLPMQRGAALLAALPPTWNLESGDIDMIYWYFGTMAAFQVGGATWRTWADHLARSVVATQRRDGMPGEWAGSWDPVGAWGTEGGRVMSTALMTLCAEVLDRHDRVLRR